MEPLLPDLACGHIMHIGPPPVGCRASLIRAAAEKARAFVVREAAMDMNGRGVDFQPGQIWKAKKRPAPRRR